MRALLDTNVLVHAHNRDSPHQERAAQLVRETLRGDLEAYLTPQVLYEFFAVVTDRRRVVAPISPREAAEICLDLWRSPDIGKAETGRSTPGEALRLAADLKLIGAKIFDCVLAVTARENGLEKIYTENTGDFEAYGFVEPENPFEGR